MRRILVLGVAVVALGACQKQAQKAEAGGEATKAAAGPAAATMPQRRAGLWTQTITTAGMTQTMKLCLDADTDREMQVTGQRASEDMCAKNLVTPIPGGMKFESECRMGDGGGVVTSAGVATGDFDTAYTVKATTTTTGANIPQANGAHEIAIQAKWEGPCPAGMSPGDMELPGGMRITRGMMQGAAGQ